MKILVVDDDLVTSTLLNKVLTKQGYEITQVTDGAKALEVLKTDIHRIILTDWMMPEMDGPTLCKNIRRLDSSHYLYIILLTAKSSKDDAVAGLESGADDYICKPFDKLELLARIRAGQRVVALEDKNRETHQKLSRSEKLAAVGHLAGGIAHEINNPIGFISSNLNSLKGYMRDIAAMVTCYREMAQKLNKSITQNKLDSDLPGMIKKSMELEKDYEIDYVMEDARELIGDCSDGAARIQSIVHEMRYFAHPEKQVPEPCGLSGIFERIVARFSKQKPAAVTIRRTIDHLPQILCNRPHLEQAFTNIIQNALEAVDDNGLITISGRVCNAAVEVTIADNGRGVPPEHLSLIFNPFFTTKEIGKGVGLGLTTALNIIRMHNGSIHCQSEPGMETVFTVQLPDNGGTI
ncbi:MAG: response regulator [Desulfobacteraceae bacterium]|jgi:signal transduction histidine kinase